jgi:hypothetical protein
MVLVQSNTKSKNEHVQIKNWDKVECRMARICKKRGYGESRPAVNRGG